MHTTWKAIALPLSYIRTHPKHNWKWMRKR